MGPTYFGVRFFVGLSFVVLLLLSLLQRTVVVLQTREGPNHGVSLVRKEPVVDGWRLLSCALCDFLCAMFFFLWRHNESITNFLRLDLQYRHLTRQYTCLVS